MAVRSDLEGLSMRVVSRSVAVAIVLIVLIPGTAHADRLCDPSFEDCRESLLNLIRAEQKGIDVAFWFMEDPRYLSAIVAPAPPIR
jgi:hypothetical protein